VKAQQLEALLAEQQEQWDCVEEAG